jgi:hypothetical protein
MRHVVRLSLVLTLALAAGLALGTSARPDSLLGGGCGSLAQTFSPWGDPAGYYFPANGGFESGAAGWTLAGGAAVVDGNEPYFLHGAGDAHSLAIPAGGSASIGVCFGFFYPGLRFLVRGAGATVHVWVSTTNVLGLVSTLDGGTFQPGDDWAPSPKVLTLFSAIASPFGAKTMQLHIDVTGAAVQIDDLYVDPFYMKD